MGGADFLQLDPSTAPPRGLSTWLTGALRTAIADGRLPVGTRLPATRNLAVELRVSRGVVVEATSGWWTREYSPDAAAAGLPFGLPRRNVDLPGRIRSHPRPSSSICLRACRISRLFRRRRGCVPSAQCWPAWAPLTWATATLAACPRCARRSPAGWPVPAASGPTRRICWSSTASPRGCAAGSGPASPRDEGGRLRGTRPAGHPRTAPTVGPVHGPVPVDDLGLDVDALTATGRHLRLTRTRYRQRRNAVLEALAEYLPTARVHGISAGLPLLVSLPELDDAALAARARSHGVAVHPLSWHRQRRGPAGLVIGYAACPPDRIREAIQHLGAAAATTRGVRPVYPADDARIDHSDIDRLSTISYESDQHAGF